jgi:hypothetical protein
MSAKFIRVYSKIKASHHPFALLNSRRMSRGSAVDVRMAADSTMLRMVNLFIALSLGVHREQLEHLIGLT